MPEKRKNFLAVRDAISIVGAAELAGVDRKTIDVAIGRGELQTTETSCGRVKVLERAAVEAWAGTERKRGPKPKAKQ